MDLVNVDAMDDSFLICRESDMDDEVTKIFKKWKLKNDSTITEAGQTPLFHSSDKFDSSTFTRPKKKMWQKQDNDHYVSNLPTEHEIPNIKDEVVPINLQIGGAISLTPLSMQKNWLRDISPPGTMYLRNQDISNSLITSSDFTNITNLLNNNETECHQYLDMDSNLDIINTHNNSTRNLVDHTFDKTPIPENADKSFLGIIDENSIELFELVENDSVNKIEDTFITPKNLTFNTYNKNSGNNTFENNKNHHMSNVAQSNSNQKFQSTPYHSNDKSISKINFGLFLSPISTENAENALNGIQNEEKDEEVVKRFLTKTRNFEDYRQSIEDHSEFILNEETIKLCKTVKGDTFDYMDDLKTALMNSTESNEKEFDEILDTFNVIKSQEGDRLLQSVDNIKQRHSLINLEKQRVEKQRKEFEVDNRTQYLNETMSKSSESVRLLNRRSRLYDDVNLQISNLQKQQTELNKNCTTKEAQNVENENDLIYDNSNRDRFKTIKLKKKLESGMVVIGNSEEQLLISPEENKDQCNQLNFQKQEQPLENRMPLKKPAVATKLSNFGFSRPSYRSQFTNMDLKLTLRANSNDSLGNDQKTLLLAQQASNLKSPMGVKAKSIHNLVFNNNPGGYRNESTKLNGPTKTIVSATNLRSSRASSLVRPLQNTENDFKGSYSNNCSEELFGRKTLLIRPSSGYFGNKINSKRNDSDTESGRFSPISLSSSSASSRSSVHNSASMNEKLISKHPGLTGTIPKSGLKQPSNLRAPIAKSGLRKVTNSNR